MIDHENNRIVCNGRDCDNSESLEDFHGETKYHPWSRSDAYGIYTGQYCDDCFENNYPYRKDEYPTQETHGYGERLDDDW